MNVPLDCNRVNAPDDRERRSQRRLAWYAYASRIDQATDDAVYRAAPGRQADFP